MVTIEDCVEAEELVKADKGIRALLKDRYGITDMSMVAADPWFYGDRYGKRLWSPSDPPSLHRNLLGWRVLHGQTISRSGCSHAMVAL